MQGHPWATEARAKSKIISCSWRCQPASIKLEEIFIFLPFIHDIITQNTTRSKTIYLYRDHSASTSLKKEGGGVDEEISKK